jgi:hypothetical protein
VPPSLVAKLEAACSEELARGCPAAKDDRAFDLAVVRGAAARTLGLLERRMATWWIERDEPVGHRNRPSAPADTLPLVRCARPIAKGLSRIRRFRGPCG